MLGPEPLGDVARDGRRFGLPSLPHQHLGLSQRSLGNGERGETCQTFSQTYAQAISMMLVGTLLIGIGAVVRRGI